MTTDLAAQSCVPCQGGIAPMTAEEAKKMLEIVPEWRLMDGTLRIERRYAFEDFRAALAFVNGAGEIAEAEGHHPDITFGWGYATVSVYTHKIKGLHENDFILAAKYDGLFASSAAA